MCAQGSPAKCFAFCLLQRSTTVREIKVKEIGSHRRATRPTVQPETVMFRARGPTCHPTMVISRATRSTSAQETLKDLRTPSSTEEIGAGEERLKAAHRRASGRVSGRADARAGGRATSGRASGRARGRAARRASERARGPASERTTEREKANVNAPPRKKQHRSKLTLVDEKANVSAPCHMEKWKNRRVRNVMFRSARCVKKRSIIIVRDWMRQRGNKCVGRILDRGARGMKRDANLSGKDQGVNCHAHVQI
jgi:hypothetical protein